MGTLRDDLHDRYGAWLGGETEEDELIDRLFPEEGLPVNVHGPGGLNSIVGHEGWWVFDSYGSMGGPVQIQRFAEDRPDTDVFPDDATDDDGVVWMHVHSMAMQGSFPHMLALAVVLVENPLEALSIANWVGSHSLPATT